MGWEGYLVLDSTEIVNVSRTEAYAADAPWFKTVYDNPALRPLLGHSPYIDPATDNAPWYDPDISASVDFWGVYPLSVEGIEDSSRGSTVTEFTTDGGTPGRLRASVKSIVVNAVLVGADDAAVEYGMRWLRRALLGAMCSVNLADTTTLGATLAYLSSEPELPGYLSNALLEDGDEILDGGDATGSVDDTPVAPDAALVGYQRYLLNSKVVNGPAISRKIKTSGPCGGSAWIVQFTITAGNPFEFGAQVPVIQGYMDPDVTNPWAPGIVPGVADAASSAYTEVVCGEDLWTPIYDPLCTALVEPPGPPSIPLGCYTPPTAWNRRRITLPAESIPVWDDVVPVLTVYSSAELRNLRVRFYEDPTGVFDPDATPCAFVGDWVLSYIPAGGTMVVDGTLQQVRVTTALGHVRRADSLVFGNDSTPIMWPRLSCGYGYVLTLDLPTGQPTPVVDLSLVSRMAA